MPETEPIDSLDRQLREAAPYIDDDGFTRKVLQQLPVRRRPQSFRATVLIGITLLACLVAYVLSDGARSLIRDLLRVATLSPLALLLLALASGILVTALGIMAAISKNHELQS
jgi:Domain of unknown function (DUF5056)